jgi:uncharacterized protein (DUF1800 family)
VPALDEANVRHLLRRTECVDRQWRVDTLMGLGSIEAAVDDVMNVPSNPSALRSTAAEDEGWLQGIQIVEDWMQRLVSDTHSFGERMAVFWHGHLCSEYSKSGGAAPMREQIDLYRSRGLGGSGATGNVGDLVKTASLQVAMLRYLDNDRNFADSPNQNFARELMELFLLGVGNYTEADVEASTAAWTGHGVDRETGSYQWQPDGHDDSAQSMLGRTINNGAAVNGGFDTIDVILGTGTVGAGAIPNDATIVANRGRSVPQVAAEFLSMKLWQEFGEADSRGVPTGALAAMRSALVDSGFDIRPWVRAMLVHDDFYADATKNGLVRTPVDFSVALMHATGQPADRVSQTYLMGRAGQRLLFPPNVSGWKPNGYWVNVSAMEARNRLVQGHIWRTFDNFWESEWNERFRDYLELPGGRFYRHELWDWPGDHPDGPAAQPAVTSVDLVDRLISYMDLQLSAAARQNVVDYCEGRAAADDLGSRLDAVHLLLLSPELHVA